MVILNLHTSKTQLGESVDNNPAFMKDWQEVRHCWSECSHKWQWAKKKKKKMEETPPVSQMRANLWPTCKMIPVSGNKHCTSPWTDPQCWNTVVVESCCSDVFHHLVKEDKRWIKLIKGAENLVKVVKHLILPEQQFWTYRLDLVELFR